MRAGDRRGWCHDEAPRAHDPWQGVAAWVITDAYMDAAKVRWPLHYIFPRQRMVHRIISRRESEPLRVKRQPARLCGVLARQESHRAQSRRWRGTGQRAQGRCVRERTLVAGRRWARI